jgi:FKBP-type peptidyl-prolyl cis-trans isomerase
MHLEAKPLQRKDTTVKNVPILCISSCLVLFTLFGCKAPQEETVRATSGQQPAAVADDSTEPDTPAIKDLPIPSSADDRFSYTYGYMLFATMKQQGFESMDSDYFAKGVWDAGNGKRFFSQEEMSQILHEVQEKMLEHAQAELQAMAEENLEEAETFLATNKQRAEVNTTDSGLQYQVLREGTGISPTEESVVDLDYQILLLDGTVLDSSYERGYSATFQLKEIKVPGFIEGVQLMKAGAKYRFWIHPSLGYGEDGTQTIEPNSLLIIDVELKSVKKTILSVDIQGTGTTAQ